MTTRQTITFILYLAALVLYAAWLWDHYDMVDIMRLSFSYVLSFYVTNVLLSIEQLLRRSVQQQQFYLTIKRAA